MKPQPQQGEIRNPCWKCVEMDNFSVDFAIPKGLKHNTSPSGWRMARGFVKDFVKVLCFVGALELVKYNIYWHICDTYHISHIQ